MYPGCTTCEWHSAYIARSCAPVLMYMHNVIQLHRTHVWYKGVFTLTQFMLIFVDRHIRLSRTTWSHDLRNHTYSTFLQIILFNKSKSALKITLTRMYKQMVRNLVMKFESWMKRRMQFAIASERTDILRSCNNFTISLWAERRKKIRIIWKNDSNKSCLELNFLRKTQRMHVFIIPNSGDGGVQIWLFLKCYSALRWESRFALGWMLQKVQIICDVEYRKRPYCYKLYFGSIFNIAGIYS